MATCRPDQTARQIQALFDLGVVGLLSDGALLDRFTLGGPGAEAAFAALVERHGPMVLRVCRSILADSHDVDDAFQATFLVLVRKASTIRRRGSCASWLHGVALRAAAGIRSDRVRRARHESRAAEAAVERHDREAGPSDDLRRVLDEELGRLRESFRSPLVLCYLEGRSCEEAARQLGWSVGTVKSRLARGRERLRGRLARRGLAPSVLPAMPARIDGAVPSSLSMRVVESATAGNGAGGSAVVGRLVSREIRRGLMRGAASIGAAVGVGLAFVGMAAGYVAAPGGVEPPRAAVRVDEPKREADPIHVRVEDRNGRPVAGVEVFAIGATAPWVAARTDAEGRSTFSREAVGEGPAFVARHVDALAWAQFFPYPDQARARDLKIELGTAEDPVRLVLLPLTREVAGQVVDPRGQPISGVQVSVVALTRPGTVHTLFSLDARRATGSPFGSDVTDERGRFKRTVPEGATVTLEPRHPRFAGFAFALTDSAPDTIPPFVMRPGGSVSGTVVDALTGKPVADATIGAQMIEHRPGILGTGGHGDAVSDARGRFSITGLEASVYNVHLWKVAGRERATANAAEAVRVRTGEDTSVELRLIEGRPLRGVVLDAGTRKPAAGVGVGCQGPAHPGSGAAVAMVKTDERGAFTFHVPPGRQYVYIADGSSQGRLSTAGLVVPETGDVGPVRLLRSSRSQTYGEAYSGRAAVKDQVCAVPARPAQKAQAVPRPAPATRTVSGHVRDVKGRPAAGIGVTMTGYAEAAWRDEPSPPFLAATTDRDGLYVLRDVPRDRALRIQAHDRTLARMSSYQNLTIPADVETLDFDYDPGPEPEPPAQTRPPVDEPVPPELQARLTFVDLDPRGTDTLADGPGGSGNDLSRLPRGVRRLGDAFFRIGTQMIHLGGGRPHAMPGKVDGILVGGRAARLQVLHALELGGKVPNGREVAAYVVHYADGSTERIPVVYGRNVGNWWKPSQSPEPPPPDARVAWQGSNESTDLSPGMSLRLFATTWTNPHPDRPITTIDAVSSEPEVDLLLVALTLERE